MIFILASIIIGYALIISWLIYGFTKINSFEYIGLKPKIKFSIIVPFRNEAENLPMLLESFSKLNYPMALFEVILVDDASEKEFKIQSFKFQVSIIKNIRLSNSPKKDAIKSAMQIVNTDWVITTDADCVVNKNWLLTLDNFIQLQDVAMIAGAVTYRCKNSFLHHFQQLDLASLQGATIGSFGINKGFMCNGANFAYTKTLFQELNGFEGNNEIASGDDVFLLQKAILSDKFGAKKVHYLKSKNTLVTTKPSDTWSTLFYQRVRWASKTTSYQSGFGKRLGILVFAGNMAWLLAVGCWLLGFLYLQNLLLLLLIKFLADAILILKANHFLNKTKIHNLILSSFLYPFFSVSVALYSLFGKYEWKGRRF
jgi:cellulose synthase/poly-beta-1,6-N-acetylglucosamine synthase-like glycosyltransferase